MSTSIVDVDPLTSPMLLLIPSKRGDVGDFHGVCMVGMNKKVCSLRHSLYKIWTEIPTYAGPALL